MRTNIARHIRLPLATIATLAAVSLSAQTPVIEQGRAALARGDHDAAIAILERAVAQYPKDAGAHYYLANAYGSKAASSGILARAKYGPKTKGEWEQAVALDPKHLDARFSLVEFYTYAPGFMGGSYDKAFAQAKEIKAIDPVLGHRAHGFIFMHQKNYGAAFAEFETALKLDPNHMPVYFYLGRTASLANTNLARGEEVLKKYLAYTPKENEPPLAHAHYRLGTIYEKKGKTAEAKLSYQAALRLDASLKEASAALKRVP